jgi:hypothetical protein
MRKLLAAFLALIFGSVILHAKTPPKPADFAGNWLLDTSQTKNVPQGLESYTMLVTQSPQQLKVQTTLKGDLRPAPNLNGPHSQGGQGTGYPGRYPGRMGGGMGRMGGMGMPMGGVGGPMGEGMPGGVGMPSGGGGRPRMGRQSVRTATAFTYYPKSAVYKLDGSESTAELGGPMHSDATSKAAWVKGNKELKLALTGNSEDGGGVNLKEQWKLSKDGEHLLIDRTLRSPNGSKTVHLIFDKQPAGSAQSASQSQKG